MMAAGAKVTFLLVVVLWRGFGYGDAETCEGSKAAYASSGFPVDDVPDSSIQGTFTQLCEQNLKTCCTSTMEAKFENATLSTFSPLIPPLNTFTSKAVELIEPTEGDINGNLSAADEFWRTAVVRQDTDVTNAFDTLRTEFKAIVDSNVQGQVEAVVSQLMTVLRLSLVTDSPVSYTEEFLTCAQSTLASEGYLPDTAQLVLRFTSVLRARFHMREIVTILQVVFDSLEAVGLPVNECVRSYAQLFYCHICAHGVAGASPCEVVCENVLAGCAGHLHLLGAAVDEAETVASNLYNAGNANSLWDFRQIVTGIREAIVQVQTASSTELNRMVDELNQCQGAPNLVKPTVEDIPQPVTAGTLNSTVPTSLFNHMYEQIFQDLKASVFDRFDGISKAFVSGHCNSAVDSGACWTRTELVLRTVGTDAVNFGEDALNENPDMVVNGPDTDIPELRDTFIPDLATLSAQLNSTKSFVASLPEELTEPSSVYRMQPVFSLLVASAIIAMSMWMN